MAQAIYISPIGWLEITEQGGSITQIRKIAHQVQFKQTPKTPVLEECIGQLEEYFLGQRTHFDLPIDFGDAPEFHQQVWQELLKIPYGKTTTYSSIAIALDNPKSVRAVGQAAGANPIAIVVPCHRLIGKSGHLTGYFYGLATKRELLMLENPTSFGLQGELF